jgi:hypothetical protein
MRFSKMYPKYDDWFKDHCDNTPYQRRIISMHSKYPDAPLTTLRGHIVKIEMVPTAKPDLADVSGKWTTATQKKRTRHYHVPNFAH